MTYHSDNAGLRSDFVMSCIRSLGLSAIGVGKIPHGSQHLFLDGFITRWKDSQGRKWRMRRHRWRIENKQTLVFRHDGGIPEAECRNKKCCNAS